ncbi:MAG: glycoside hydrolase family 88 protein [Segetibacter sp.]|nr:glycoside hydrolase family 88 protein [Segetibacter sp.]
MKVKQLIALSILLLLVHLNVSAQPKPLSQQMAATVMEMWKDSFSLGAGKPAKWSYDQGVILKGFEGIWKKTGDPLYFNYIQKSMDFYVDDNGNIKGYRPTEYNIDHVNNGKILLLLYRVTGKEKYWKAATKLRDQLRSHPRTSEGGFWHKEVYPSQMWLDGLYMGTPFYAEYAYLSKEDTAFNDIAKQFILMEKHARDPKTGLLYHGWDESKQQKWANKETGTSPNFWGRSLGWYAMALVDVLDYMPAQHPQRKELIAILNRLSEALVKVQDPKTGTWYQVVDKRDFKGNYPEASATSMFVYALAKGTRKGYLPIKFIDVARKGYKGITQIFIKADTANQTANLMGTVMVSGLGGNPYRDGSVEYYLREPVIVNDPKGMGAFILAANEMEMQSTFPVGKGKVVLLDNFFNNETKKDATGNIISWHYTWDEMANGGFSLLGNIFEQHGATTATLKNAPTASNLSKAAVFIIVDPDSQKETPQPNYMNAKYADVLYKYVQNGGVLALFTNDSSNTELKNFNILADKFGLRFNYDGKNMVQNNQFEQGLVNIPANHSIFKTAKKVFIKELSTLQVKKPATAVLTKDGDNIIAVAKVGKGTVFAVGDPWLYNEYIDGRKLPLEYENYKASVDLVKWLLQNAKK